MADVLPETVSENHATGSGKTSKNVVKQHNVLIGWITEKTSHPMHFWKILVVGWSGLWKWNHLTASLNQILLLCCLEHFVSTDYKRSLTEKRKDLFPFAISSHFSRPKYQVTRSKGQSEAKKERRNQPSHIRLHVPGMKVIMHCKSL